MNAAFSASTASTIEGRIILTAENRTGQGFAEALRDLQRYTTQANKMQQEFVRGQKNQHRMHEQGQRDIEKTTNMAGSMFASFVTGVTAAATSVGIVMGNMATAYRDEVKNMTIWHDRLKDSTKLSSKVMDDMAKDIAEFMRLPSTWDARRVMTATARGAGNDTALIRRRTEAVIDLQTKMGANVGGPDVDIMGTLNLMRTPRGAAAAVRLLAALNDKLYVGPHARERAVKGYERVFEREGPEAAYKMLLSALVAEADRERKAGTLTSTRDVNKDAVEENRRLRYQDDIIERGGKQFNEGREAFLKVMNDMTAQFIPFYDSLSEANKGLAAFGLALGAIVIGTWGAVRALRLIGSAIGLGGGLRIPGGGPRMPRVPGARVPRGPRLPLGLGKALGPAFAAWEVYDIFSDDDPAGRVDEYLPSKSTWQKFKQGTSDAVSFDQRRLLAGKGPREMDRMTEEEVGRARRTHELLMLSRRPSVGGYVPAYSSGMGSTSEQTGDYWRGQGDPGMHGGIPRSKWSYPAGEIPQSTIGTHDDMTGGDPQLSYFTAIVKNATKTTKDFNDALRLATMTLGGTRGIGMGGDATAGVGAPGGALGSGGYSGSGSGYGIPGSGAGGISGGTAGVGAPGGAAGTGLGGAKAGVGAPGWQQTGVGMSGGAGAGGGTGFGPAGKPGSEFLKNTAAATAGISGAGGSVGRTISSGEGGYGSYNRGVAGDSRGKIDFSKMTIGEVMQRQALRRGDPNRLFAVGKYQVIPGTMREAVRSMGIDPNSKLTPELQERIFRDYLIDEKRPQIKSYITGQSGNLGAAQLAAAQEFASVADPRTGRSVYGGTGGNRASISAQKMGGAMEAERAQYQKNLAAGMSPDEAWLALSGTQQAASGSGFAAVTNTPSAPARNMSMAKQLQAQSQAMSRARGNNSLTEDRLTREPVMGTGSAVIRKPVSLLQVDDNAASVRGGRKPIDLLQVDQQRDPIAGLAGANSLQLGRGAVDINVKLAKQLQAAVPSVLPASHFDLGVDVDRTGSSFSRPGDPAFPPAMSR
jgi:hypothetical protein